MSVTRAAPWILAALLVGALAPERAAAQCLDTAQCAEGQVCLSPLGQCGEPGTCEPRPELCPRVFFPVCGCDGVTYGNPCEAAREGSSVAGSGGCGDRDLDGVPDDEDNCPAWRNGDQVDSDGNGIGDACECGDANEDGTVDVQDILTIARSLFRGPPFPYLCDTTYDAHCNVNDILGANHKIFGGEAFCRQDPPPGDDGLRYFRTCGDPVCGAGQPPGGVPVCTTQQEGGACSMEGALCHIPDDLCNTLLLCSTVDPTLGGCPISRAEHKQHIEYLDEASRRAIHDELLEMPLARWEYAGDLADGRTRLGFIIDDQPRSAAVLPGAERVDLYGLASMAVATLQVQAEQLRALEQRLRELEAELEQERSGRCEVAPSH